MLLHIVRPRPMPEGLRSSVFSSFPKNLKSFPWSDFLIPHPVSCTDSLRWINRSPWDSNRWLPLDNKLYCLRWSLSSPSFWAVILMYPFRVNFRALDKRLTRIWLIRYLSKDISSSINVESICMIFYKPFYCICIETRSKQEEINS